MKFIFFALAVVLAVHAADTNLPMLPGLDPVPGLNMGFAYGFDVKSERTKMPLFQWTYDYQQKWKNPQTGITYLYPDQLFLTEIPKGKIVKDVSTFSEYHQYISMVAKQVGISIGVSYDGIDVSVNFQRANGKYKELVKGGTFNFGMENRYIPMYQLDMWPDAEYNTHLQQLIKTLPETISGPADQAKYDKFISSVGTHYCVGAQFGGYINFTTIFSSVMNKVHTGEWVAHQVGISVGWQEIRVGIDVGRNTSMEKMDQTFVQNSYNETNCVGGQCYLLEEGKYDRWLETVLTNPGMLPAPMTMYPVTELLADKPKQKALLFNAVKAYLKKPLSEVQSADNEY